MNFFYRITDNGIKLLRDYLSDSTIEKIDNAVFISANVQVNIDNLDLTEDSYFCYFYFNNKYFVLVYNLTKYFNSGIVQILILDNNSFNDLKETLSFCNVYLDTEYSFLR